MFRGYAKFPGVGIRAMPVVCRSFDLTHLLFTTTLQPHVFDKMVRIFL